jgi:hypothetical protein
VPPGGSLPAYAGHTLGQVKVCHPVVTVAQQGAAAVPPSRLALRRLSLSAWHLPHLVFLTVVVGTLARLFAVHTWLCWIVAVLAIGAMGELRHRDIGVPEQVSVAGFDDIPVAADLAPALTTVRMPLERMGAEAVRLALEASGPPTTRQLDLPVELVVRSSTAPPPRI